MELVFLWNLKKLFGFKYDECYDLIYHNQISTFIRDEDNPSNLLMLIEGEIEDIIKLIEGVIIFSENGIVPKCEISKLSPTSSSAYLIY